MKITKAVLESQQWKANQLVEGFHVEDVWHLPIQIKEKHSTSDILETFVQAIEHTGKTGLPGALFKFRNWLGKIFHWEDEPMADKAGGVGILRTRYAQLQHTSPSDLPGGGFQNFDLVYEETDETLLEIENKTVQAAIHFGKTQTDEQWKAQMTIYVKPNGLFGRLYMLAIKPFRHYVVYPALLNALARQWKIREAA